MQRSLPAISVQETAQRESVQNFQALLFFTQNLALKVLSIPVMSYPKQIIFTPIFPCARENQYYLCGTVPCTCRLSAAAVDRYCSNHFRSGLGNFCSLQYRQKRNKLYHVQSSIGCSKVLIKFYVITFLKVAIRASLSTQQAPCTWPCRATLQQHL